MQKRYVILLLIFIVSTHISDALPRFALRTGRTCASCHFNYSGGQLRNSGGTSFAQEELSLAAWRSTDTEFSDEIAKNLFLGADSRMQYLNQSGGVSELRTTPVTLTGSALQFMQFALYIGATPHERLKLFAKVDITRLHKDAQFNPDGLIFEAFGILNLIPKALFLKAGVFLPSYGIRYDDHTLYTRGGNLGYLDLKSNHGLIFKDNYRDLGFELGFAHENLINAQIALLNGGGPLYPSFGRDLPISGRVEVTPSVDDVHLRIGGSLYSQKLPRAVTNQVDTIPARTFSMFGGFFGVGYDRFTLMGEFDQAKNLQQFGLEQKSSTYFAELGVQIMEGLDFVGRYEAFDPNTDVENDEETRIVLGVEYFPWNFVEVRPQYRIVKEKGLVNNEVKEVTANQFITQFHFWF